MKLPNVEAGSILRWKQFFHRQKRGREGGNSIQTLATAKKLAFKVDISSKIDRKSTQFFKTREKLDLNSVQGSSLSFFAQKLKTAPHFTNL
jgi:hypothetical protein